jgi:hypothetical protein
VGPGTADLAYDAARLCALAARRDPRWLEPALGYLEEAIGLGQNPRDLANPDFRVFVDPCFRQVGGLCALSPACPLPVASVAPLPPGALANYLRYRALLAHPAPRQPAAQAARLLDFCTD